MPVRGLALIVLLIAPASFAARSGDADDAGCTPRASAAYTQRVTAALRSGRDVCGEKLVAAPGGPSFAGAARYLAPTFFARAPRGRMLTRSGAAYLPFSIPTGPSGASEAMLHVADGSEILARRSTGPSMAVMVGGGERYGSCIARLRAGSLAGGWLPILRTGYRDATGGRYDQESFAARAGGKLAAYVRVTASARAPARVRVGPVSMAVPRGTTRVLHARWAPPAAPVTIGAAEYATARATVGAYWRGRLAEGAALTVPESRVQDAVSALRAQGLTLTWRYSLGNAYEQFSFPEVVDTALVLGEHGFGEVERAMLLAALPARPTPYPNWKMGEKLLGFGSYYGLYRDRATLASVTPTLAGFVAALERQLQPNGLLPRERYSSDIPDRVYGLHAQARVWRGLREIAAAWDDSGRRDLASRARTLAARLGTGLRSAVSRSRRPLPDGSLFVPMRLLDAVEPYGMVTESRQGSYWNLVAPYAFASGLFEPSGTVARGASRYLRLHGARLLGLVRTGAYVLYGEGAGGGVSGVNPVYGLNDVRFLAALDRPDRLVLALYGQLAAGMTRGTFVSGEGTTVAPLDGALLRTTYLPPNSAAGAAFLQTLRLLLVHESADALELAFATPRPWLAAGKRVAVSGAPTRFGPVSYSIEAGRTMLRVTVQVPSRSPPKRLRLRLRLPAGQKIGSITPRRPVDRRSQTIDLSGLRGTVELEVTRR